jgi:hypothetical protein
MSWFDKPVLANLDVERVLCEVRGMRADYQLGRSEWKSAGELERTMAIKYKFLHENYPPIFNMVMSASYDYERLKFMLEMAKKVERKEIAEHDASVAVGERLVNEVVKPQLKEPKQGSLGK